MRMRQLAEALVAPVNGWTTRTIVNRLWARFMGRGLSDIAGEGGGCPEGVSGISC